MKEWWNSNSGEKIKLQSCKFFKLTFEEDIFETLKFDLKNILLACNIIFVGNC
jgi:hypothetical protein